MKTCEQLTSEYERNNETINHLKLEIAELEAKNEELRVYASKMKERVSCREFHSSDKALCDKCQWRVLCEEEHAYYEMPHEVQIFKDNYDITHNPRVKEKYPNLYAEVSKQDSESSSSCYTLSPQAYIEYKQYYDDASIDYVRPNYTLHNSDIGKVSSC